MKRNQGRLLSLVMAVLIFVSTGPSVLAQGTPPTADRVEEDWELVVTTPDSVGAGPQITTAMAVDGGESSPFAAFNLNYRDAPFAEGGIQTMVWSGKSALAQATQGSALFQTPGEVVTWTQILEMSGGAASYAIRDGNSTTWGKFGQGEGLLSISLPTSASSLAGYSADRSATRSGVGWQADNVTSLTLVRVRYYAGGQLLLTDETPRSVSLKR